MKKYLLTLVAFLATITINAENRIDLGEMQLDTDYRLEDFKNYIGTFTAPRSGVLTCSATTNDVMYPYHEVLDDMYTQGNAYDVTMNSLYGGRSYDFNVEEGKTYIMYANFIMNSNTVFRMTMADAPSIEITGTSPAEGATLNITNNGQVSISFNKAVACTGATATVGSTTKKITAQVNFSDIFFETKSIVWNWLQNGTAKPGDVITFTINGVSLASDRSVLYNGDGVVKLNLVIGEMPITLVDTENTSNAFLSYYTTSDERGLVKLTFSGKVSKSRLTAILRYGDIDQSNDGEYYYETLQPTLSEDGCTVIVNLQNKRRRAQDMVSSGTNYGSVALGITGVLDTNGNYAYAEGSGSLGSYWFAKTFEEVTANVVAEFSPLSGSDITAKTKNFEIWITDEKKLSYDGVAFDYEKDGETKHLLVENGQINKENDPDDATASILTFAVPEDLIGAKNVELSFQNLQCADGGDYSSVLRAKYNTFVVDRATPVANSTMEWLSEGQTVKIVTNKDSALDYLHVVLRDMNPAEDDKEVLFEADANTQEGVKGFCFVCERNYRLERGHDYHLEVTGWLGSEIAGSDYVVYHGAADPFRYSDVLLESITPDADTAVLTEQADNEITLTFDGLVMLNAEDNYIIVNDIHILSESKDNVAIDEITAIEADEEGFANTWKLTIKGETVTSVGENVILHIVATDLDGHRVQGNTDYKDYNHYRFTYNTDYVSGIELTQNLTPALSKGEGVYNVAGQRVNADYKGIVIKNGQKFIVK